MNAKDDNMAIERTFSMIKPDATKRNLTGAITKVFEENGLRVVASKRVWMAKRDAEAFYAEHTEVCTEGREDRSKELSPDPKGAEGIFQSRGVYFIKRLIPIA